MAVLSYFYASFHTFVRGYFWPQNKSRLSNSMYTVKSCFNYMFSGAQQFLRSMRKFQKEYLHLHGDRSWQGSKKEMTL